MAGSAKQSILFPPHPWIASRSLSSGAHSRDPLARNDVIMLCRDASRRRSDWGVTVPFGHQGTGWEVAYAALFLISNESSYVNAHTLFLDAGHMAGMVRS